MNEDYNVAEVSQDNVDAMEDEADVLPNAETSTPAAMEVKSEAAKDDDDDSDVDFSTKPDEAWEDKESFHVTLAQGDTEERVPPRDSVVTEKAKSKKASAETDGEDNGDSVVTDNADAAAGVVKVDLHDSNSEAENDTVRLISRVNFGDTDEPPKGLKPLFWMPPPWNRIFEYNFDEFVFTKTGWYRVGCCEDNVPIYNERNLTYQYPIHPYVTYTTIMDNCMIPSLGPNGQDEVELIKQWERDETPATGLDLQYHYTWSKKLGVIFPCIVDSDKMDSYELNEAIQGVCSRCECPGLISIKSLTEFHTEFNIKVPGFKMDLDGNFQPIPMEPDPQPKPKGKGRGRGRKWKSNKPSSSSYQALITEELQEEDFYKELREVVWKTDEVSNLESVPPTGFLLTSEEMKQGVQGMGNPKCLEEILILLKEKPQEGSEHKRWTESEFLHQPNHKDRDAKYGILRKVRNQIVSAIRYHVGEGPLEYQKKKYNGQMETPRQRKKLDEHFSLDWLDEDAPVKVISFRKLLAFVYAMLTKPQKKELKKHGFGYVDLMMSLLCDENDLALSLHLVVANPEQNDTFHNPKTRNRDWIGQGVKDIPNETGQNTPSALNRRTLFMDWHSAADIFVSINLDST